MQGGKEWTFCFKFHFQLHFFICRIKNECGDEGEFCYEEVIFLEQEETEDSGGNESDSEIRDEQTVPFESNAPEVVRSSDPVLIDNMLEKGFGACCENTEEAGLGESQRTDLIESEPNKPEDSFESFSGKYDFSVQICGPFSNVAVSTPARNFGFVG